MSQGARSGRPLERRAEEKKGILARSLGGVWADLCQGCDFDMWRVRQRRFHLSCVLKECTVFGPRGRRCFSQLNYKK